jgi:50S ribosomal protein L16 3-hydroxylase
MPVPRPPLGGLSPKAFLRGYWQKQPLLVRQAIPGFQGLLDSESLFALAGSDEVEARLIEGGKDWRVTTGPIAKRTFSRLPKTRWTLLVNGINLHCEEADALLARFAFASWARIDDVMVSYAVDEGGVGPHADSYDVFLLQGPGRRRWRLMPPGKAPFKLVAGAPLKQIAGFRPTQDMVLDPGDMLYVPPGWGHEGTAMGACQTYSIGFRAPGAAELSAAFLDFLHEKGFADTTYTDKSRRPARHPAQIDVGLLEYAAKSIQAIQWTSADVGEFLGRYLSEPKQHVVFEPPRAPLRPETFLRKLTHARVRLDPRTRMLTLGGRIYVNGAGHSMAARARGALQALADSRQADGAALTSVRVEQLVYEWYCHGFLTFGKRHD